MKRGFLFLLATTFLTSNSFAMNDDKDELNLRLFKHAAKTIFNETVAILPAPLLDEAAKRGTSVREPNSPEKCILANIASHKAEMRTPKITFDQLCSEHVSKIRKAVANVELKTKNHDVVRFGQRFSLSHFNIFIRGEGITMNGKVTEQPQLNGWTLQQLRFASARAVDDSFRLPTTDVQTVAKIKSVVHDVENRHVLVRGVIEISSRASGCEDIVLTHDIKFVLVETSARL